LTHKKITMPEVLEKPVLFDEVDTKPPMIFLELVDQNGSGFIQDGTRNTANPVELRAPNIRIIPNEGYRRGKRIDIVNGKEVETRFNEKIRFIKNEDIIVLSEQRRLGIERNGLAREDKIVIEKGYATVVREGSTVGLYDYLVDSYYNESNIDRSEKATALYRIVRLDDKAESFNEDELLQADAIKYVGSLYQRVGKNQYQYNEDKITAICELLSIYAETMATRIQALMNHAKQRPEWFLNKVTKLEQTTVTEITHALELNVIRIKGSVVEYANKNKVIKTWAEKLTKDQVISRFADWLRTQEGHEAYMELKAEIDVAQTKSLNS